LAFVQDRRITIINNEIQLKEAGEHEEV